jgi:hypothetical protein
MVAVITVHGTFASGEDTGPNWWQKGNEFEKDLRAWVESEDGKIDFLPQLWDGANSEASRRAAALDLLLKIRRLEEDAEKYCLIGHSHGGSVVAAALVASVSERCKSPNLSRWITIGTPFIARQRHALLFTRIGIIAKSAYLTCVTFGLLLSILVVLQGSDFGPNRVFQSGELILWAFSPLIILHVFLWFVERRATQRYYATEPKMESLAARWLSLRHPADEAISSLRAVEKSRPAIFGKDLIVEPAVTIAGLLGPIVSSILVWVYLVPSCFGKACYPLYVFVSNMTTFARPIYSILGLRDGSLGFGVGSTFAYVIVFLIGFPAILFFGSLIFILSVQNAARLLSGFVSRQLDRLAWKEIRKRAFGDDAVDSMSVDVDVHPLWAEGNQALLPPELADELIKLADTAAATSVSKFRLTLQQMMSSDNGPGRSQLVAEYLTWDELIHTTYFKVARFRKLLAYAISQSPGFRVSENFRCDPDFEIIASWYRQVIQTGSTQS